MIGKRSFPFGMGYFQVRTVSFSEGNPVPPRFNVSTPQNPLWPVLDPRNHLLLCSLSTSCKWWSASQILATSNNAQPVNMDKMGCKQCKWYDEVPLNIYQPTKHSSTVPFHAVPPWRCGRKHGFCNTALLVGQHFFVIQLGGNSWGFF